MKKELTFILIILFLSILLTGCNNYNNQIEKNNYSTSRTSTTNNNTDLNTNTNNNDNNTNSETYLSSFSTIIYTPNDEARQNNIRLTCSFLNNTIVKSRRNIFFLYYCWKSDTRKRI